jgi:hypothetical protein
MGKGRYTYAHHRAKTAQWPFQGIVKLVSIGMDLVKDINKEIVNIHDSQEVLERNRVLLTDSVLRVSADDRRTSFEDITMQLLLTINAYVELYAKMFEKMELATELLTGIDGGSEYMYKGRIIHAKNLLLGLGKLFDSMPDYIQEKTIKNPPVGLYDCALSVQQIAQHMSDSAREEINREPEDITTTANVLDAAWETTTYTLRISRTEENLEHLLDEIFSEAE